MKPKLTILAMLALLFGACTSGTYISRDYTDDIYFNPGDVPPPITVEEDIPGEEPVAEKSAHRMIISDIEENEEGSQTMSNYIFEGTEEDADALTYGMDQLDMYDSDTTVYYNDDEVKYVINNYYDADAIDYAYRIRRFHRPYFYDPFYWDMWYYDPFYYSSWYYPSWSMAWNWGWGYGGWYSPYSSWGWGYSPYYSYWHSPYYAGYYGGWGYPYYSGWYGHGYYGNLDPDDYRYGRRPSRSGSVYYGGGGGRVTSASGVRSSVDRRRDGSEGQVSRQASEIDASSRRRSTQSVTRDANIRSESSSAKSGQAADSKVLTERRRSTATQNTRQSVSREQNTQTRTQTYTRPGSSTTRRTYTRPRVVTHSKSSTNTYSTPRSTPTYNRSYRSSSTYNKSSAKSSSTRTYRTPSRSSRSTGTYRSAPSRSSGSYRSSGSTGSSRSYSGSSSRSSGSSSSGSSSGRRR